MGENCIMCVRKERDWYVKLKTSTVCFRGVTDTVQGAAEFDKSREVRMCRVEGVWWNERCPRC